jgi:hypothetical protein
MAPADVGAFFLALEPHALEKNTQRCLLASALSPRTTTAMQLLHASLSVLEPLPAVIEASDDFDGDFDFDLDLDDDEDEDEDEDDEDEDEDDDLDDDDDDDEFVIGDDEDE